MILIFMFSAMSNAYVGFDHDSISEFDQLHEYVDYNYVIKIQENHGFIKYVIADRNNLETIYYGMYSPEKGWIKLENEEYMEMYKY